MKKEQHHLPETGLAPDIQQLLTQIEKKFGFHESNVIRHLLSPDNLHRIITYLTFNKIMPGYSQDYVFHILTKINNELKILNRSVVIKSPGSQFTNGFGIVDSRSSYLTEDTLFERVNQTLTLELMSEAENPNNNWDWKQLEEFSWSFPKFDFKNYPNPNVAVISTHQENEPNIYLPLILGPTQLKLLQIFIENGGYIDEQLFFIHNQNPSSFLKAVQHVSEALLMTTGEQLIAPLMSRGHTFRGKGMPRANFIQNSIENLDVNIQKSIFRKAKRIPLNEQESVAVLCEPLEQLAQDLEITWPFKIGGKTPYIVMIATLDGTIIVDATEDEAEIIKKFDESIELNLSKAGLRGRDARQKFTIFLDRVHQMGYRFEYGTGLVKERGPIVLPLLARY